MNILPDSNSELVWVSAKHQLPDVCCTCGMYTDKRAKVKFTDKRFVQNDGQSGGMTLLHIICLFLGPIGWLLAAIVGSSDQKKKTKTDARKIKVMISQCQLCNGTMPPEPVQSVREQSLLAFITHPEFCKKFEAMNQD